MHRNLIINADDFGWDEDTVSTTISLLERGVVRSASLMTGRPASDRAISYAINNQAKFSFGLHFNIVDGHKPLSKFDLPSLITDSGVFRASNPQRLRALAFRLSRREISCELDAQISHLVDRGIKISHVDSHGHLHKFPEILASMKPILRKYGITKIRFPQSLYQSRNLPRSILNLYCQHFFRKIKHPDNSFFLSDHSQNNWFMDFLSFLPYGTTELGIHPGDCEDWRKVETKPFLDERIGDILKENNIDILSYSDL